MTIQPWLLGHFTCLQLPWQPRLPSTYTVIWSHLGLIKDMDLKTVSAMEEVEGEQHVDLEAGCNKIAL